MTTTQVRDAIEAWAAATTSANTYDAKPARITESLPVVIGFIDRDYITATPPDDLGPGYDQRDLRVYEATLWLLVDPEPAATAETALNTMVDQLVDALGADRTLGNRIWKASRRHDARYQGEVEYEDGGIARQVEMKITVANPLEAR